MAKALLLGAVFLFAAVPTIPEASPRTILWAAPSILIAAMLIAWGAETAQFFIAQGFALAILAWMQTLPEFAVEAVLAWHRQVPYLFANLTGALRLLTGLGWPMIYFSAAVVYRRRERKPMRRIMLQGEHSVQVVGLLVPLIYTAFIVWKGSLHLADSVVLTAIYAAYLAVLGKMPPQEEEGIDDLERIPRAIVLSPRPRRIALIAGLFIAGGLLIYFSAEPFLASLFAISIRLGVPAFVFIQWVAPFISEFPEGLSTFYWARTVHRAPMDGQQKLEVLMTIGQQLVGMLFLVNMELAWWEAASLFVLWLVQFFFSAINPDIPFWGMLGGHVHRWITIAYFAWAAWELVRLLLGQRKPVAFTEFAKMWRQHVRA
jgi:cation:H+ antiporter